MPRMPLMEYEEPAESVLTDDTCVTEPVDTARRERGGQGPAGGPWGRALRAASRNKVTPLHWADAAAEPRECGTGRALRALSLRQPLHLGDGSSPRGPLLRFSASLGAGVRQKMGS